MGSVRPGADQEREAVVNDNREISDDRADALLKLPKPASEEEEHRAAAEQRSAQVTLADIALIAADGDGQAAADMLREALEITGFTEYESVQRGRRVSNKPIANYERPGR
jgi:hypothetical protein